MAEDKIDVTMTPVPAGSGRLAPPTKPDPNSYRLITQDTDRLRGGSQRAARGMGGIPTGGNPLGDSRGPEWKRVRDGSRQVLLDKATDEGVWGDNVARSSNPAAAFHDNLKKLGINVSSISSGGSPSGTGTGASGSGSTTTTPLAPGVQPPPPPTPSRYAYQKEVSTIPLTGEVTPARINLIDGDKDKKDGNSAEAAARALYSDPKGVSKDLREKAERLFNVNIATMSHTTRSLPEPQKPKTEAEARQLMAYEEKLQKEVLKPKHAQYEALKKIQEDEEKMAREEFARKELGAAYEKSTEAQRDAVRKRITTAQLVDLDKTTGTVKGAGVDTVNDALRNYENLYRESTARLTLDRAMVVQKATPAGSTTIVSHKMPVAVTEARPEPQAVKDVRASWGRFSVSVKNPPVLTITDDKTTSAGQPVICVAVSKLTTNTPPGVSNVACVDSWLKSLVQQAEKQGKQVECSMTPGYYGTPITANPKGAPGKATTAIVTDSLLKGANAHLAEQKFYVIVRPKPGQK